MIRTAPLFAFHGVLTMYGQHTDYINPRPAGPSFIYGMERLATEPIGTFSLTLTNVVVGSICDIEVLSTGDRISYIVANSSTVTFTGINVYQAGDPKNSLKIKVRNATSPGPYYQPYETQTTAFAGSASIFVNQVRDDI